MSEKDQDDVQPLITVLTETHLYGNHGYRLPTEPLATMTVNNRSKGGQS